MKVLSLALELHVKRLLQSILTVGCVTALVWCFCYSIRSFFREEPLHLTLLMVLLLKTLPALIPFLSAVSAQLCVIRMYKNKEWPLLELMGFKSWRRHIHFLPAVLLLCFVSALLDVPYASVLNEKGQSLYLKQQLAEVRVGRPILQGNWNIFRLSQGNLLLQGEKQWVLTQSIALVSNDGGSLQLKQGTHWSEREDGTFRKVSFSSFHFPLKKQAEAVDVSSIRGLLKGSGIHVMRVFLLPLALYFLGYQLGWLHHRLGFRHGAVLTFICLFLVYYPSTILVKNFVGADYLYEWPLMFLPHLLCLIMAKVLVRVYGSSARSC